MSWRSIQRTALAVTILALGGAVVAGTGGQAQAHPFRIEGCSLGCTSGPTMVTCGIVNVHVNKEFAIDCSLAVDLSSVTSFPASFRVINTLTGQSRPGPFDSALTTGARSSLSPGSASI